MNSAYDLISVLVSLQYCSDEDDRMTVTMSMGKWMTSCLRTTRRASRTCCTVILSFFTNGWLISDTSFKYLHKHSRFEMRGEIRVHKPTRG